MSASALQYCTECGQHVSFSHPQTLLKLCPCGKTVLKRAEDGSLMQRRLPMVQSADSLLQPGTRGSWQQQPFTVLGRLRLWQQESVYNYWTISFENKELALLAEGYGIMALLQFAKPAGSIRNFDTKRTGDKLEGIVANRNSYLQHYLRSDYYEIEGEVWMPGEAAFVEVRELLSKDDACFELFQYGEHFKQLFTATPVALPDLALTNTRRLAFANTTEACRQCKQPNQIIHHPYSRSFACLHCGSRHVFNRDREWQLLLSYSKPHSDGVLKPGMKGTVQGQEYLVLSYAEKQERNGRWREYGLLSTDGQYAFLSESMGHWMLVKELYHGPLLYTKKPDKIYFQDRPYYLFNEYFWTVEEAAGSFPYNIFNDDGAKAIEYIAPPYMLICETDNDEGITWYQGQHVEASEVENAFGASVPYKIGVGPVQPVSPLGVGQWLTVLAVAILATLLVQLGSGFFNAGKQLDVTTIEFENVPPPVETSPAKKDSSTRQPDANEAIIGTIAPPIDPISTNKSVVLGPYELSKWRSNLQIDLQAPLDNSWASVQLTLVHKQTGKEYSQEEGMEYYYGYTDGENWKEGDREATVYFSSLPAGTYSLQVDAQRQERSSTSFINLWVLNDTSMWRNFWWCLLAISIYPLWMLLAVYSKEKKRWANSPFTPYDSEK